MDKQDVYDMLKIIELLIVKTFNTNSLETRHKHRIRQIRHDVYKLQIDLLDELRDEIKKSA